MEPEIFLGGKGGRCVGLTTLPHSCADCREIWVPQLPATLRTWTGIAYTFMRYVHARTSVTLQWHVQTYTHTYFRIWSWSTNSVLS